MKVNAKARHPDRVELSKPERRCAGSHLVPVLDPKSERQQETECRRGERDPARRFRVPACSEPGQNACDERNDDEPYEHHDHTTNARNTTEPSARPAAYQRTNPVCVSWRARYMASVSSAIPV